MMSSGEPYSGLFGAYRYAFRKSNSRLFRAYVAVSALVGVYVSILLLSAVIWWAANPLQFGEKALLSVAGVLVLGPLFGPVLIVARRYRLGLDRPGFDVLLALAGAGFLVSVWLGLFVSAPDSIGNTPFPRVYGLVPPVVAALLIYLVVRYTRPGDDDPNDGTPASR